MKISRLMIFGLKEAPFHTVAYYLRKIRGLAWLGGFVFDVGEGHADAARRFDGQRRALHSFYRGCGWWRLLGYSIGYLVGSAQVKSRQSGSVLDLADGLGLRRAEDTLGVHDGRG